MLSAWMTFLDEPNEARIGAASTPYSSSELVSYSVASDDFEFLFPRLLPFKCWNYRCEIPHKIEEARNGSQGFLHVHEVLYQLSRIPAHIARDGDVLVSHYNALWLCFWTQGLTTSL